MSIPTREQKEVTVGENRYLITALTTTAGFETLVKLKEMGEDSLPDPLFLRKLIMTSVTINNMNFDADKYERTFSRKHQDAMALFQEIVAFNFGGDQDPNVLSDTSE
jgi:hypothetical protein